MYVCNTSSKHIYSLFHINSADIRKYNSPKIRFHIGFMGQVNLSLASIDSGPSKQIFLIKR